VNVRACTVEIEGHIKSFVHPVEGVGLYVSCSSCGGLGLQVYCSPGGLVSDDVIFDTTLKFFPIYPFIAKRMHSIQEDGDQRPY